MAGVKKRQVPIPLHSLTTVTGILSGG